jgi:Ca2+-binding EF-hand superfamily protein
MATEVQSQKYEKIFSNFDVDSDGDIDQTDVDALIYGWCLIFDVAPGSPEWRMVTSLANRWWQDLIGTVGPDGNKTVSKEEWAKSLEQPGFIDNVAIPLSMAVFDLADKDGDGNLSRAEYLKGATAGRATITESLHAFSLLDKDGDGYISKEEYRKAVEDFYKGTDPDGIGNYLT